ncbi:MAG: RNA polymerase sigma factor region1.1 domain-containing protein, partial [Nitrospirota bacterium]|nr:RNA polymerase sigma factor region1.1 domain-containing protein [Nitrospirota bacterium]
MAKQAAQTAETQEAPEEAQDSPLLDTLGAAVKRMVAKGKERGYVTYDEINAALPPEEFSSEQIEDTMSMLSEMGINVVENEEAEETQPPSEEAKAEEEESTAGNVDEADLGRTDDPVRMYLREMGSVELLSREGEIAIAKRIEAGRDTMILGLCESPITFNAIIDWSTALNEGTMQLREIMDLDAMLSKDPAPEAMAEDGEADDGEI